VRVPVAAVAAALTLAMAGGCGKSTEEQAKDVVLEHGGAKEAVRKLSEKGVPHLEELLESKSRVTRMAAIDALGYIKDDPKATELLLGMTQSSDDNDVSCAILALARQGVPETKEIIEKYFKHENPSFRAAACVAIGVYGDKQFYPLLDQAMRDPVLPVQNTAGMIKEKYGIGR
jgi:HEAT repeat protein